MGIAPFVGVAKTRRVVSAEERLRRLEEAKAFLLMQVADGPQPAWAILRAARAAGIATRTLNRAKAALGVRVQREGCGGQGQWMWLLLSQP
jgi:hypothetical protein